MLEVLILVCSVNLAPADCQVETALDVISGGELVNAAACGLMGQARYAALSLAEHAQGQYLKIRCQRPHRQAP